MYGEYDWGPSPPQEEMHEVREPMDPTLLFFFLHECYLLPTGTTENSWESTWYITTATTATAVATTTTTITTNTTTTTAATTNTGYSSIPSYSFSHLCLSSDGWYEHCPYLSPCVSIYLLSPPFHSGLCHASGR